MNALIKPDTCSTCPYKEREPDGKLTCHRFPPGVTAIIANTPKGPQPIGQVTAFPVVQPEQFCHEHPALKMKSALGSMALTGEQ